jgi:hypothetical protein
MLIPELLLAAPLFLGQSVSGQTTPTPRLPPANPLPVAGPDEANVLAPVNVLLDAIRRGDGAAAATVLRPEGGATSAIERADGSRAIRRSGWSEFTAALKPDSGADETISDPAIEIDGDIAMVWAPYTFRLSGRVKHCGTNHFDLVREGGAWRILNVTWTQRTTGCAG